MCCVFFLVAGALANECCFLFVFLLCLRLRNTANRIPNPMSEVDFARLVIMTWPLHVWVLCSAGRRKQRKNVKRCFFLFVQISKVRFLFLLPSRVVEPIHVLLFACPLQGAVDTCIFQTKQSTQNQKCSHIRTSLSIAFLAKYNECSILHPLSSTIFTFHSVSPLPISAL